MFFFSFSEDEELAKIAPEYGCVTPLRLLLKKRSDPDLWKRLGLLMDHDEERRMELNYWKMFQVRLNAKFKRFCHTY